MARAEVRGARRPRTRGVPDVPGSVVGTVVGTGGLTTDRQNHQLTGDGEGRGRPG